MATLKDIAQKCGVSTATVSYVMSGKGDDKRISPQMQDKIRRAAEVLDYTYKVRKRDSLSRRIIVYFPLSRLEMIMPTFIEGFRSVVSSDRADVDIIFRPYELDYLNAQSDLWNSKGKTVAIIISPSGIDLANLSNNPLSIKAILVNRRIPGYSSVTFDSLTAGKMAASHAEKKGGGDVALVLNSNTSFGVKMRGNAMVDYFLTKGIDIKGRICLCDGNISAGYQLGQQMIKAGLPKVILCAYDMPALGINSALCEAGIRVGEEVQIIATASSKSDLFKHCNPPMTVVDLRFKDVCKIAVQLAIDTVTDKASYPQDISIPPEFIFRKSCPR